MVIYTLSPLSCFVFCRSALARWRSKHSSQLQCHHFGPFGTCSSDFQAQFWISQCFEADSVGRDRCSLCHIYSGE